MATFEQDLDLRGKVRLINTSLQLNATVPTYLSNRQGGVYFDTADKNIKVNPEGTATWYNTLLWNSTTYAGTALPIFSNAKKGYIENLPNSSSDKFVYLDTLGQPKLTQYITKEQLLSSDIVTSIIDSDDVLPTSGAVYDYVASAISAIGSYLPLAGGTMAGDITMSSGNKVIFNVADNYVVGSSTVLSLVGKTGLTFRIGTTAYLSLTSTSLLPSVTASLSLGSISYTYDSIFTEDLYVKIINAIPGSSITVYTSDSVLINAGLTGVVFSTGELSTSIDNTMALGASDNRWSSVYSYSIDTNSIVLSGATGLTAVSTTISGSSLNTQIPTALAVWNLFDSIDPFNTTAGSYGTVATNTALANKDLYYLRGDNTWQSLIWDLTGTTVSLKTGIATSIFNVTATTTLSLKVRSNYTIESYYNGGNVTTYIGDIGEALLTDFTYPLEVVSDLRTRSSIWFGGTLSTAGEIELQQGSDISAVPVLTVGSSLLQCGGITTNGTNVWQLGNFEVGIINQVGVIEITIDGVTRYVNYGTIT